MKVYDIHKYDCPDVPKNVSCIGFFDGVHKGHKALIELTVKKAKEADAKPFVITFYPDPSDVIDIKHSGRVENKKHALRSKHIMSLKERLDAFEKLGIEGVMVIRFNKEIMVTEPKDFVDSYLCNLNLAGLVCGYDFTFGIYGSGNCQTLLRDAEGKFAVYLVPQVSYYHKKISSSTIKIDINEGNIKKVNRLLSFDYSILLYVLSADENRIVAINRKPKTICPKKGHYQGYLLHKGERYDVDINIDEAIEIVGYSNSYKQKSIRLFFTK